MDTAKIYYDSEGNERTIHQMVKQEQTEKTKDVTHKLAEKVVGYVGRTFMEQGQMTKEDIEQIIYNDEAILIHGLSNAELSGKGSRREDG